MCFLCSAISPYFCCNCCVFGRRCWRGRASEANESTCFRLRVLCVCFVLGEGSHTQIVQTGCIGHNDQSGTLSLCCVTTEKGCCNGDTNGCGSAGYARLRTQVCSRVASGCMRPCALRQDIILHSCQNGAWMRLDVMPPTSLRDFVPFAQHPSPSPPQKSVALSTGFGTSLWPPRHSAVQF